MRLVILERRTRDQGPVFPVFVLCFSGEGVPIRVLGSASRFLLYAARWVLTVVVRSTKYLRSNCRLSARSNSSGRASPPSSRYPARCGPSHPPRHAPDERPRSRLELAQSPERSGYDGRASGKRLPYLVGPHQGPRPLHHCLPHGLVGPIRCSRRRWCQAY